MRKLIYLLFLFYTIEAAAQQKLLYFDENGQNVSERNSAILLQQVKLNDTLWQFNVYNTKGPRIRTIQSNDENGSVVNGRYITYDYWGYIDSSGYAYNNTKEKTWNVYKFGRLVKQITYENGAIIKEKDSTEINEETKKYADSMKSILHIDKSKDMESEFGNGNKDWENYLFRNLRYPENSISENITGVVIVEFSIDTIGKVGDIEIYKSVEYSLDMAIIAFMQKCPNWHPCLSKGRKVKSYKKLPLVFTLSSL